MKKLSALLLALVMAVSFSACGGSVTGTSSTDAGTVDDSWTKIEKAGQLVLGLDDAFPPMGYVDTNTGEIIGFDIDLAKEVCKRLNIELKLQPIDWDSKSVELSNGNIDCIWNGFSKTPEREKEFNLSNAYMQNNQIILVKTDSAYKGLNDLSGKTVGVQADSSAETALNNNTKFKSSLKEVVQIGDYNKAVMEIQNGTIDAIAIDEVVARFYLKQKPDAYRILEKSDASVESLAVEDYVVAFRKKDDALKQKINGVLDEMAKDGTMTKISQTWFSDDVTVAAKK